MASIYDLKPKFQALLRPITGWLARIGVTANQVTVLAALLSVAAGTVIALWPDETRLLLLLPGLLLVRMALNAIDGMLAREHNQKSNLGAILNELGDVIADAALYLPLALVPGFEPAPVVIFTLLAVVSEMTGVLGVMIGGGRRYEGPLGKSDRAFVIGLLGLLLGVGVPTGWWLHVGLGVLIGLAALTILNRARKALREAKASGRENDE
jgi:CDP-diacylglycerol--glycerol-3-phosphate 3-phosphatidyltransferase